MKLFLTVILISSCFFVFSQESKYSSLVFYKKENHLTKNKIKDKWTHKGIVIKQKYYYWFRLNGEKTVFGRIVNIDSTKIYMIDLLKKTDNYTWVTSRDSTSININEIMGLLLITDQINGYFKEVSLQNYSYALKNTSYEYYPIEVISYNNKNVSAYPILTNNGIGFINPKDSIPKVFGVKPVN